MIASDNHMRLTNDRDRNAAALKRAKRGLALSTLLLLVLLGRAAGPATVFAAEPKRTVPTDRPVSYEAFGAVGDGVADDLPAIVEAHAFANAHGLAVQAKPGATYHLGRRALTAVIATDIDWGTARFIIDDTEVENHR
ncbi:MAG TPA: hypothetical protein P5525_17595, partial [Candidatus Paceibacterota bacterium]|nr:hypothetical protein [Candidatus Paceibacterota bacterium]